MRKSSGAMELLSLQSFITVPEEVASITVRDMNGLVVYTHGAMTEGESIAFGNNFIPGLYTISIVYSSGRIENKRIQKV